VQQVNLKLPGVAEHDSQREATFYDVGTELEARELSQSEILHAVKNGQFASKSHFFRTDPQAQPSRARAILLQLLGRKLMHLRTVQDLLLRWSG
jgi:hypothetical protein